MKQFFLAFVSISLGHTAHNNHKQAYVTLFFAKLSPSVGGFLSVSFLNFLSKLGVGCIIELPIFNVNCD